MSKRIIQRVRAIESVLIKYTTFIFGSGVSDGTNWMKITNELLTQQLLV